MEDGGDGRFPPQGNKIWIKVIEKKRKKRWGRWNLGGRSTANALGKCTPIALRDTIPHSIYLSRIRSLVLLSFYQVVSIFLCSTPTPL